MSEFTEPKDIVQFWTEAGPEKWFKKDTAFDAEIRSRFLPTHEAAAAGKLNDWEKSADGALALLILLDQFPRNMFRNDKRAFATDPQALAVAGRAITNGFDAKVDPKLRTFFYLPYQHVEDLAQQERGVGLYHAAGDADGEKWARIHADIIRRFGRFPHRNAVLGRETSAEERAFLEGGGFAG
jgi:uncharacterized protein (DUF924 family)